jgi:DNA-binding CsgD family transcriptional regulator
MQLLRRLLLDAGHGEGRAVVLAGEAGVGKSRLANEVLEIAREGGMAVLSGRAVESGRPAPFRPLGEALLSHLRRAEPGDGVSEPFRAVLSRLLPGWAATSADAGDGIVMLGEAVLRLLRGLASPGCVLALEDLHWADLDTLAVVAYLADNLVAEPVLLLMTARDDERSEATRCLRGLTTRRAATWVDVRRLHATAAESMAAACLQADVVPASLGAMLMAGAEGLPFLIEELLTSTLGSARGTPPVPESFAETVRRRLHANPGLDEVLRPAAILGRSFDWDSLPVVTGLPEHEVTARLRLAVEHRIVDAQPDARFRFRHALTRAAILADLLPPERTALVARVLPAVEAAHPGLPGAWCELAAELAEQAGQSDHAATLLLEAGRRALGQGALATAEASLERARGLAGVDRDTVVEADDALCTVLALAGNSARLAEVAERLLAGLVGVGASTARVAGVHLRLARAAVAAADWPTAEYHLRAADGSDDAEADVLAAAVALGRHQPDDAAVLARRALAVAQGRARPELACEALEVIGRCERTHDLAAAERAFAVALETARAHGLPLWQVRALHELGTIDLLGGTRVDRLVEARAAAHEAGALSTAATIGLQVAAWHLNHAEVDRAVAAAREFADEAHRARMPVVEALGGVLEASAHALAGRRADMDAALAGACDVAGADPEVRGVAAVQARAAYWLVVEDRARALTELDAGMELLRATQVTAPFRGMWALVHALENADGEAAVAEVAASGLTVYWLVQGWVGHAEAVLLGRAGKGAEAVLAFAAADRLLAPCPWYRQHARRLVAEAALADGWGDPTAWLVEALVFFDDAGYGRIASACRALLRRAGAVVPRRRRVARDLPAPLHVYGLTARETEVLALLGEALPTREIAEALFVSPKTVERHIANLAAKIGVRGRAELIAFAAMRAATPQ